MKYFNFLVTVALFCSCSENGSERVESKNMHMKKGVNGENMSHGESYLSDKQDSINFLVERYFTDENDSILIRLNKYADVSDGEVSEFLDAVCYDIMQRKTRFFINYLYAHGNNDLRSHFIHGASMELVNLDDKARQDSLNAIQDKMLNAVEDDSVRKRIFVEDMLKEIYTQTHD